ncbi:MAG: trypsin-like serine protease [Methylococcaceae bacterium]|nr:trypsin-like serine protease [Methylococcaceae bacterium]
MGRFRYLAFRLPRLVNFTFGITYNLKGKRVIMKRKNLLTPFGIASVLSCAVCTGAIAGQDQVSQQGPVTVLTIPSQQAQEGVKIDYVNAKPMELPIAPSDLATQAQDDLISALSSQSFPSEAGGYSPGGKGDGKTSLVKLGVPAASDANSGDVASEEFGTTNHPFSTARADLYTGTTNTIYPYRASGKLFFNKGTSTFVCSASLIKKGIVVTAAHCVANFGKNKFYSNWRFVPGYRNGVAPFGSWTVKQARVLTAYLNGTDPCVVSGIVCRDDVAVLALTAQSGVHVGNRTGWYGYGWNGYGFTGNGLTQITQIGYPVCLDNGGFMERNDSQGFKSASNSNNTVIGSLMCGGSSGGPWLVNFGRRPALTGTSAGTASIPNIVVGVASWGYVSNAPKEMGASPFLTGNIATLVNAQCASTPGNC